MTRPTTNDDAGFSLIEVVVAMAVFAVLASVSLGILVNTTDVTADSIRRTAATNLVNTQLQTARSLDALDILDGRKVVTQRVGGTTYTITQTATYVASNATTSVCSGSGNSLAYKLVRVSVTWPNMGSIKPVKGDTLRAVGVGTDGLNAAKGTLAVSITGSTGQATSGVDITLTPGNIVRTTGDDGCAIFTGLSPGTYTATGDTVGFVGTANTQAASVTSLAATAGNVTRGSLLYDTDRSVKVVFDGPAGAIVPANLVLRAGDSYVPEATLPVCTVASVSACTTGVPGTLNNLFPETYKIKAGTCAETTPSQAAVDLRPATTDAPTVTVPMGAALVKVALNSLPNAGIAGRSVTFTHAPGTGCAAGESYSLTSVAGTSALLLPYGTWTVSVPVLNALGVAVSVTTQTVTFSPATPLLPVNLLVAL